MNKVKLILNGWVNSFVEDQRVEDLAQRRAEICALCPHAKWSLVAILTLGKDNSIQEVAGMACEKCGCPLPAKVRSPGSECPLEGENKKWESVNLNNLYMETRKIVQSMEDMSKQICRNLQIMRNAGVKREALENLSTDTVNKLQGVSERIFEIQGVKHAYQRYDFAKGSRLHRNGGLPIMNKEKAIMSFNTELNSMKIMLDSIKIANAYVSTSNKLIKNDEKTTALIIETEGNITKMKDILAGALNEKEETEKKIESPTPEATPSTPVATIDVEEFEPVNTDAPEISEEEKKTE